MKRIGITGDLGSGKSFIANKFALRGVPVYNCDRGSKNLVMTNSDLILEIKAEFGEYIYVDNVFKSIAKLVFLENDDTRLKKLMSIISPYINVDMEKFYEDNKDSKFCLVESAILYESKMEEKLDDVIYVAAPEEIRIKRAMERDGMTEQEYHNRMKNQISYVDKIKNSKYIIYNAEDNDWMAKVIDDVYEQLSK